MKIQKKQLIQANKGQLTQHKKELKNLVGILSSKGINANAIIKTIQNYEVAIPSWALGAGGTRFGRFGFGGEPSNLHEKLEDIGVLHALTHSAGAVSLHIPWDIPNDPKATKKFAKSLGIKFDAMNSNTFQDQPNQKYTYKYGSLCDTDPNVRNQAVRHNKKVIDYGVALGSKSLTVWLADGANFPGQNNFRTALNNTLDSLKKIYKHLPKDWKLFIEYKPYEPNFYSMVIQDWGTSFLLANALGPKAFTLVDLGHHLPNTNIEQIVATLMSQGKLGGFHFNDSKYGDDDLTVGAIKPYQLFLIFSELVFGMKNNKPKNPIPAWMIDASHNIKDPLEDLLQSIQAIEMAYAKALLIDQKSLALAQKNNDITWAQEILAEAYQTDVRPLLAEARRISGTVLNPIQTYRSLDVRSILIAERGADSKATGL